MNMKKLTFLLVLSVFSTVVISAQTQTGSIEFWKQIQQHCGKSYEGVITAGAKEGDGFTGEKLVMHVRSCDEKTIKIPFHVGNNHSRTWVLTLQDDNRILLKHDHRNEDGSEEEITQYGGLASNTGLANIQSFPADQFTADMLPRASNNVWWFTIDENTISYNLKVTGSDRQFSVAFDLSKEVDTPPTPWGHE